MATQGTAIFDTQRLPLDCYQCASVETSQQTPDLLIDLNQSCFYLYGKDLNVMDIHLYAKFPTLQL